MHFAHINVATPPVLFVALLSLCLASGQSEGFPTSPDEEVMALAYDVIGVMYDPDNWYHDYSIRTAFYPDVFELFWMGKLPELFYSSDYRIDISRPPSGGVQEGVSTIFYHIFILPRIDPDHFYLASNRLTWDEPKEDDYDKIRLVQFDVSDLLRVRSICSSSGGDLDEVPHEALADYLVQFVPFGVTMLPAEAHPPGS